MGNILTPSVEWSLMDEGLGILERAGIAGLYLSLYAAEEMANLEDPKAKKLSETLEWELSPKAIQLRWKKNERKDFENLISWAWQILDGVFYLPGAHRTKDERDHPWRRLEIHTGLLQTFLQLNRVLSREKPINKLIFFDENKSFKVSYQKIKGELPQLKQLKKILKKGINGSELIPMPSWVNPGSAKRFGAIAKEETSWTGSAKDAFILLFAPIICFYFELPMTRAKDKRGKARQMPNWLFLVPEIKNLEEFYKNFTRIRDNTYRDFLRVKVHSLEDAGLRFACAYTGREIERVLETDKIYVVAMGKVGHYQGQNVRKRIIEMTPSSISVKRYLKLIKFMPNEFVIKKSSSSANNLPDDDQTATHRIWQPTARGLISANLVKNTYWYRDLALPPSWQIDSLENQRQYRTDNISQQCLWFENLQKERRELMDLVKEETMWDKPEEKVFVSIFHNTLRHLLDKEGQALSRGGTRSLAERWDNKIEKIRRDLMHAKTLSLNRKILTEFLAEGGGGKDLTENRSVLWGFINHPYDWKKSRDLALLSLVTFTDGRLG